MDDVMKQAEILAQTAPKTSLDDMVKNFWDCLFDTFSHEPRPSYYERIELLAAKLTDLEQHRRRIEGEREVREADRLLREFNEIFEAHVRLFWAYAEKTGEATWETHKEAARVAWARWATKANRTIQLMQTRTELVLKNLKLYGVQYPQTKALQRLNKLTEDHLLKAWLHRQNPLTGEWIE